jgi:hypothetical protein
MVEVEGARNEEMLCSLQVFKDSDSFHLLQGF